MKHGEHETDCAIFYRAKKLAKQIREEGFHFHHGTELATIVEDLASKTEGIRREVDGLESYTGRDKEEENRPEPLPDLGYEERQMLTILGVNNSYDLEALYRRAEARYRAGIKDGSIKEITTPFGRLRLIRSHSPEGNVYVEVLR